MPLLGALGETAREDGVERHGQARVDRPRRGRSLRGMRRSLGGRVVALERPATGEELERTQASA